MGRWAELMLEAVPAEAVRRARDTGVPLCAAVRLPVMVWSAGR